MTYRQEFDKVYKKIEIIAQRGDDGIMDFNDYIDQLLEYGQYGIFIDVMDMKYFLDVRKYKSVQDMKKDIYPKIKFQTKSKFSRNFQTLLKNKNVFLNGFHFYDSNTTKYLGDINEVDAYTKSNYAYYDSRLNQLLNQSTDITLKITLGLSSSFYSAISEYPANINREVKYVTYSQVIYNGSVYECVNSYTWTYRSPITPTYSEYWSLSSVPTYSVFGVTSSSKTLLDKYSEAIDIIKNAN